ncbi:hypothetical protein AURDEDRAFT_174114 [Auricularia subglabra TFB-10046 SS5]|nr:hypothetical protein AURDEDRAFT_174114 [Auricularia subglabra TFB-10046 SS5]
MRTTFALVAALSVAPFALAAKLGKTPLFTEGLRTPLIKFETIARPKSIAIDSSVPSKCEKYAKDHCDLSQIEAREVWYDDCDQSWTLCRCPDANMSFDQMVDRFATLPVGIRSYVGAAIAVKKDKGCVAYTHNGEFIRFIGDCGVTVFLHEAGHTLDKSMSKSDAWHDAVANSTCVPDSYANASYAEDWTQSNVLYTYTKQFGKLPKDTTCMKPQMDLLVNDERINEAQDAKKCLPDRRPFKAETNTKDPGNKPPPAPEPEKPEPAPEPEPAEPKPEEPKPPKGCKSAKFRRLRRAAKDALRAAAEWVSIGYSE